MQIDLVYRKARDYLLDRIDFVNHFVIEFGKKTYVFYDDTWKKIITNDIKRGI